MTCSHFEREGLDRLLAGETDPHLAGCTECQAARATYQKLIAALAHVDADVRPKAGWEQRVVDKIRAERAQAGGRAPDGKAAPSGGATARKLRWWIGGGGTAAVAAAAGAVLLMRGPTVTRTEVARWERPAGVTRSAPASGVPWAHPVARGEEFRLGDGLRVASKAGLIWAYQVPAPHQKPVLVVCDARNPATAASSTDPSTRALLQPSCDPTAGGGARLLMVTALPGDYSIYSFDHRPTEPAPATPDEATALFVGSSRSPRIVEFTID